MTIDASLNKRLDRVVRKQQRIKANGVVHRVGRDGLIRSRPRLVRPRAPLKGILMVLGLIFLFKALLFAKMGSGNYAIQVEQLQAGNAVERVGAFVMQEDPITVALGGYLSQYVFPR